MVVPGVTKSLKFNEFPTHQKGGSQLILIKIKTIEKM